MRFGNPAAWLGLGLLVLPILVHMLVRDRAPVRRLPTLRFLEGEPPVAIRWSRPDEPLLLLLRLALIALAVVALARPWFPAAGTANTVTEPARVVLVDESWSMTRLVENGSGTAADRAQGLADAALAEVPSATRGAFGAGVPLPTALEGAAAWLATRPGPGEIVVVSDFQLGLLDEARTARVPDHIGLVPVVVGVGDAFAAGPLRIRSRAGLFDASVAVDDGGATPGVATITWSPAPAPTDGEGPTNPVRLVHAPSDDDAARALNRALDAAGGLVAEGEVPVTVVFPGADLGASASGSVLEAAPAGPLSPAAADLVVWLATDPLLAEAARRATPAPVEGASESDGDGARAGGIPVARDRSGQTVLEARAAREGGLLLMASTSVASVFAATLVDALARATHAVPPGRELEAGVHLQNEIDDWAREPRWPPAPDGNPGAVLDDDDRGAEAPPARWAWMLVLGLLAGEGVYRKRLRDRRG
jgi:hypothetical protein